MRFSICCAPNALGEPKRLLDVLVEAGADYLDWSAGALMAGEREFEQLRVLLQDAPLRPEAFLGFLPPTQRITGPNVRLDGVLEYASEVLRRARALGGEIMVLGSSAARRVPQGFDPGVAREQFIEFCRELGPRADEIGVTITIEPLNRSEDNLLTHLEQGTQIVDEVGQARIQLVADYHHLFVENEPLRNITAAGKRIRHAHIADRGRAAPGYASGGEADLRGFFAALRSADYNARCSCEGSMTDLVRQAKPVLALMRERYDQSAPA